MGYVKLGRSAGREHVVEVETATPWAVHADVVVVEHEALIVGYFMDLGRVVAAWPRVFAKVSDPQLVQALALLERRREGILHTYASLPVVYERFFGTLRFDPFVRLLNPLRRS